MVVTAAEMRGLEEAAFARGVSADALMDQAGARCAEAIRTFFPEPGICVAVFGKGNNGGDALVTARHLAKAGWEVRLTPAFPSDTWGTLVRKKFRECGLGQNHSPGEILSSARATERRSRSLVVLDGLLGLGARGTLPPLLLAATREMEALRQEMGAHVFALDLPSGLEADSGVPAEGCVRADFTLTIGAAKRGLLADGATGHVGRLVVVPLDALELTPAEDLVANHPANLQLLPRRSFETHKGEAGRVAIIAGSRGLTGAAVLCSSACARAGAGLVTLYVPDDAYEIIAAAAAPEVMVRAIGASYLSILETRFDVLAVGPGLGQERGGDILQILARTPAPTVIDADGLNILAGDLQILRKPPAPRLLTPHPGEMQRLAGGPVKLSRAETARQFTEEYPVTLLLKGARTVIAESGSPLAFNSTGHPGMASGGMGDVLTGVCAALAGQGLPLYEAARVGAWVCGRAAEMAIYQGGHSTESLTAPDVIAHLGTAFTALRRSWV